jgi:hypothetical protein
MVERSEGAELVHYFSPFCSAAWMPARQAEAYLQQDDQRWSRLEELEMVSDAQRTAGPPRIEYERSDGRRVASDQSRRL